MEKLQKKENFKTLEEAVECYDELYAAYEASIRNEEYYKNLYDYVAKEKETIKERYEALAHMVNNAAELVSLLNNK